MPRRKYKRPASPSSSGPPRKSLRKPKKGSSPQPQAFLSNMSTHGESQESWPLLAEGAYIIPFSYGSWETTNPSYDRAKAWGVLHRCFPEVRRMCFAIDNINGVSNGLTIRYSIHIEFGKFNISLKPTDVENEYEVKYYRRYPPSERRLLPKSIEFEQTEHTQQLALPSRRTLLDCHYRLAEILNASGLGGGIIERHMRKREDLIERTHNLIREDGGTDIGEFYTSACGNMP